MACKAHGHGTIRLHELAIPFSIESMTAALMAWYIPKSSALTMSMRASGAQPSSSVDRTEGAAAADSELCPSIPDSVKVRREVVLAELPMEVNGELVVGPPKTHQERTGPPPGRWTPGLCGRGRW
jgi:hypothetical protein